MIKHPIWLRRRFIENNSTKCINRLLYENRINTVCKSSNCPNIFECFSNNRLTFLILGDICTRRCTFCSVKKGVPKDIDETESDRIKDVVKELNIRHVVITSVARDDLKDGGAQHFKKVINSVATVDPTIIIEILTPDFKDKPDALDCILDSKVNIFGHNLETVKRLYPVVRCSWDYEVSLELLKTVKKKKNTVITKSNIMVGIGETRHEVSKTLYDIRGTGCDIVTIGQYLRPDKRTIEVKEFVSPELFEYYKTIAKELGFLYVACGPFVRSSNYLPICNN